MCCKTYYTPRTTLFCVLEPGVANFPQAALSPYFAAKAGMATLAVQYARELTLWGIETSIITALFPIWAFEPSR